MNVNKDIKPYKIRHSPDCIYWTWLLKSIKDKSTTQKTLDLKDKYKWNWLNKLMAKKYIMQGQTHQ
jgi:hypothetical protein